MDKVLGLQPTQTFSLDANWKAIGAKNINDVMDDIQ
jgi:hypothetical protein